jgi:branched-subunit amino acid ABC-type transport system permease component
MCGALELKEYPKYGVNAAHIGPLALAVGGALAGLAACVF